MSHSVSIIGLSPRELPWIRTLVALLRHPDPSIAELTRQALLYLSEASANAASPPATPAGTSQNGAMLNCLK